MALSATDETSLAPMSLDGHIAPLAVTSDLQVERRLVRRIVIWVAILMPVGAAFFAGLMLISVQMSSVSAGPPLAMGAGLGALAGFFFGMWAGVVASVSEIERNE